MYIFYLFWNIFESNVQLFKLYLYMPLKLLGSHFTTGNQSCLRQTFTRAKALVFSRCLVRKQYKKLQNQVFDKDLKTKQLKKQTNKQTKNQKIKDIRKQSINIKDRICCNRICWEKNTIVPYNIH